MNLMNLIDDEQSLGFMETKILNPSNSNTSYLSFGKGKNVINDHNLSDEDDPEDGNHENMALVVKGRKGNLSQWQRMRWSDSRVRLLIQVVACVGDDDGTHVDGGSGRKSAGCLQKKGKWKMVSKVMVSKGCQVSPQQCEDKFNDLNKRYKRLNDILGKGVSCRVVENPSLMDSLPRLSSKMKEDVKKVLSSKHLFYPEMCAYHNGQRIPNCTELDLLQAHESAGVGQCGSKGNGNGNGTHSSDEVGDHDDSDDDIDDENHEHRGEGEREKGTNGFLDEMNAFLDNPNNSKMQKREWIKMQFLQLQEQRIEIETEALEMEKRRFKWERFCDRKDGELEISRLEKEKLMLENERIALQLKHSDMVIDPE